jgi:hypothetical protein
VSIDLNETLVPAIVQLLENDLQAAIEALNTAGRPNGIPLPMPVDIFDHPASPGELVNFPTLTVADMSADWPVDAGNFALGVYQQRVDVHLHAPDQGELAWQVRGYGRALANLFHLSTGLQDLCASCALVRRVRWVPGATLDREEAPRTWQTWASLVLACTMDE